MVKRDSIDEKNTNFILENLNSELKKIDKKKTFTKNNNKFINKKENKLIYANLNKIVVYLSHCWGCSGFDSNDSGW